MRHNKIIKVTASVVFLLLALWIAVPKVYIHDLLNHDHTHVTKGDQTAVNTQSADDCDFDSYDKPVYFSIFKFLISFIPVKSSDGKKFSNNSLKESSISFAISLLRAPPVAN